MTSSDYALAGWQDAPHLVLAPNPDVGLAEAEMARLDAWVDAIIGA